MAASTDDVNAKSKQINLKFMMKFQIKNYNFNHFESFTITIQKLLRHLLVSYRIIIFINTIKLFLEFNKFGIKIKAKIINI